MQPWCVSNNTNNYNKLQDNEIFGIKIGDKICHFYETICVHIPNKHGRIGVCFEPRELN